MSVKLQALSGILGSKKGVSMLLALAVILLAGKLSLSHDQVLSILGVLGVYQVSQGIADHGKEKAKIEYDAE